MRLTTSYGIGFIRLPHARRLECELAELAGEPCPPSRVREFVATLRTIKFRDITCVLCMAHVIYEYVPWGVL